MDALKHDKIKVMGDLIERYMELKPECSGAFWNAYEFAEMLLDKVEEIDIASFEAWHETHHNDPTPF